MLCQQFLRFIKHKLKFTTQDDREETIDKLKWKLIAMKKEKARLGWLYITGKINKEGGGSEQVPVEAYQKRPMLVVFDSGESLCDSPPKFKV